MTSKVLAFAIATILTASVLVLTLSNQVFAQPNQTPITPNILHIQIFGGGGGGGGATGALLGQPASNSGQLGHTLTKLAGQITKSVLGDVCLSCWGGLAAHETQQAKELAGKLGINNIDPQNPAAELGQQGQTTTGTGNLRSTAPNGDTGSGSTLGSTNQPCSSSSINSITVRNQDSGFDLIPCIVH